MKLLRLVLVNLFALTVTSTVQRASFASGVVAAKWPRIVPMKVEMYFEPQAQTFAGAFQIFDTEGQPSYLFECHDSRYSEAKNSDFDYSGDFECRLVPIGESSTYSTLFTEQRNQSRDWQSRARFLAEELIGGCAEYPDFGATREFRLRGMKIKLVMSNIVFRDNGLSFRYGATSPLKSFRFSAEVVSDTSATSEIAMPSSYLPPPRVNQAGAQGKALDCDHPRKR